MIKEFIQSWEKHKEGLKKYLQKCKQSDVDMYAKIVKILFDKVINKDCGVKFNTENIVSIDDGDYQGTEIFILHKDIYQPGPSDYVYTNTYYGSCSGCDTLQAILEYDDEALLDEEQINDLINYVFLNLLQKLKYFEE